MVVALMVTPALGLTLLAKAPTEVRESRSFAGCGPGTSGPARAVLASARPAFVLAGVPVGCVGPRRAVPRRSFTPSSRTRTAGPTERAAGHLPARDGPDHGADERRDCAVPGRAERGRTRGSCAPVDQVVGTEASELWVTIDPEADYDATRASIEEVVHGYPGLDRDVVTYPSARIDQVLAGSNDPITVRISGRTSGSSAARPTRCGRSSPGSTGVEDPRVARPVRGATLEIEVDLDAAERLRDRAGRRPAGGRDAAVGHPGRQPLRRPEGVRRRGVGNAGGPRTICPASRISRSTRPPAGRCGWAMWPTCGSGRPRRSSGTWTSPGASTSPPRRRVATCGAITDDVQAGLGQVEFPMEYHAALVGDYAAGRAADRQALGFAIAAAIAVLLLVQAAIGNWRLAALDLPDAAPQPLRRRGRRAGRRTGRLDRVRRRVPRDLRARRPPGPHADPACAAPRAARGPGLRRRARRARSRGTVRAGR